MSRFQTLVQIQLRLPPDLLAALNAQVAFYKARNPGVGLSRSDLIRRYCEAGITDKAGAAAVRAGFPLLDAQENKETT